MLRGNVKICAYIRFGSRVYSSFKEMERERKKQIAMSKMTPEQIEFCENWKKKIEAKESCALIK